MSGRCNIDGGNNMKWASDFDLNRCRIDSESDSSSIISSATTSNRPATRVQDSVKQRMRTLFETQRYADVTFYPKDNRATSIAAHKAVLAVGSPFFEKMLYGENTQCAAGVKLEVQISNMSFTAFSNIVKYLYTDEIFFETDLLVMEILEGAAQFEIQSLVERCKSYFESINLTERNVCSKYQISISKKIEVLKNRCADYVQKNTLQVLNSTDFLNSSQNTVKSICKLQSLNLHSEAELLEAVMRWVNAQTPQNKQMLIETFRKCIRFLTFTVNEFGDAIKKYPQFLTSDESLKIMLYLYNPSSGPDFNSLPSWCNKTTVSRCTYQENISGSGIDQNDSKGKLVIPLKSSTDVQHNITELVCLLQMKCTEGHHQINAITLSFKKPTKASSMKIFIKVRASPNGFTIHESLNIVWSEEVKVPLSKPVFVRRGDLIDIEVEAKDIELYEFLQFDKSSTGLQNCHFTSSIASRPKHGRLYFIKEVEYGPQINRFQRQRAQRKF